MNALKAVPISKQKRTWVVGMTNGAHMFVTADDYYQEELSLVFYNGEIVPALDLVIQFERLHVAWFMPETVSEAVLVSGHEELVEEEASIED